MGGALQGRLRRLPQGDHGFSPVDSLIVDWSRGEKYLTLYVVLGRLRAPMPKKQAIWSSVARRQPKKDGKSSLCTELSTERVDREMWSYKDAANEGWSVQLSAKNVR